MKKLCIVILLVAVAFGVFALSGCTAKDANILKMGDGERFDYVSRAALSADWNLEAKEGASIDSVFVLDNDLLRIELNSMGFAKATQKVNLAANTYYLLEYSFTSTNFQDTTGETGFDGFFF